MRKNSSAGLPASSQYTAIYYIEGISSSVTLSPTLVDPARVSVIRVVDGQDTGLSAQPAENRLQTGTDQDFHLHVIHRPGHEADHVIHRTRRSEVRSSELTSTVIPVPALQTRPCCR